MELSQKTSRKPILLVTLLAIASILSFSFMYAELNALKFYTKGTDIHVELHMLVRQYRNGVLISETYHAMTLTNFGKNWIDDNLFNPSGTNASNTAYYIAMSNDTSSFSASWTMLPNEITASSMGRTTGTYQDTGTGTSNTNHTWTASGTVDTRLYGLYIGSYAAFPNSLIAAEQQTPTYKHLLSGDSLLISVQKTIS